jgi:hypothetical protein
LTAPISSWSITLTWQDLVAIVSLILAVDGYRRVWRSKKTAGETRLQLLRRVAAESFHNLAGGGFEIEAALAEQRWERGREHVDRLRLALAEASGSWSELLVGLEQQKADAVGAELTSLQGNLYACGDNPSPEQVVGMRQQCATAYTLLAGISGKLRYSDTAQKRSFWAHFRGKTQNTGGNQ